MNCVRASMANQFGIRFLAEDALLPSLFILSLSPFLKVAVSSHTYAGRELVLLLNSYVLGAIPATRRRGGRASCCSLPSRFPFLPPQLICRRRRRRLRRHMFNSTTPISPPETIAWLDGRRCIASSPPDELERSSPSARRNSAVKPIFCACLPPRASTTPSLGIHEDARLK